MKIGLLGDGDSVNTQNWVEGLRETGAEVVTWSLPRRSSIKKLLSFFSDLRQLKIWLGEQKPDVLIGYRTSSYGFLGALAEYHPYVIAAQAMDDASSENNLVRTITRMTVRYAINKADMIHVWAPNMAESLISRGASPEKLFVLPRGIDLRKFVFKQRNFNGEEFKMIVTRSLFPEYHIDEIIRTVAILVHGEGWINIRLTITGSGPLEQQLKKLCQELKVNHHVEFTGRISNRELPDYLAAHDFYVSLPDTEGASASLFEAFASGLFPIVTDLPANRIWIKHNYNGLLVPVIDSSALATQLKFVRYNSSLCSQAVEVNRKTAEHSLSLQQNMKKFISAYEQLLANQGHKY